MGEFELIARYFQHPVRRALLGVGDDCALLAPASGMQLAVSSDMLVAGRHFFENTDPEHLGHKALAVNLSDLAACGARPLACTLALALPCVDSCWLDAFSRGLLRLAAEHHCELIGGDTTAGPLNLCITVIGEVPAGYALLRSGACAGDDVWVSGTLGDARFALDILQGRLTVPANLLTDVVEHARLRLETPTPRVALGQQLRGIASSAIDVSDGLLGDLAHILAASGNVGAEIVVDTVTALMTVGNHTALEPAYIRQCTLAGGDDYELVFTAPPARRTDVMQAAAAVSTPVTRIGRITTAPGLRLIDAGEASPPDANYAAFDHFKQ